MYKQHGERTVQAGEDLQRGGLKVARSFAFVVGERQQVCCNLGVSLGFQLDAGGFDLRTQGGEVFDDAVVDDGNLAVEGTEGLEPVRRIDAFRELTASSTNMAREAAGVAQQRTLEARETVANRARQAWGTTRSALEAATKGADNAPDKAEGD